MPEKRILHPTAAGRKQLEQLAALIKAPDFTYEIDEPLMEDGVWWIDLTFGGITTVVSWQPHRCYGVYAMVEDGYNSGPVETYRDPVLVARRLGQMVTAPEQAGPWMQIRDLRTLLAVSQVELAARMGKTQPALSRLESQNDALLSTIRTYVESLGGEVHLTVRFPKFDALVDIPASHFPPGGPHEAQPPQRDEATLV